MRFSVAAVALAGVALAAVEPTATEYTTKYFTVTDCPETKTDCPADATSVTSSVIPLTTSTLYTTRYYTVTSCPPTVPKCPAASTVVVTETEVIGTTVCPVEPTPTGYHNSTIAVPTKPGSTGGSKPTSTSGPKPTVAPECPSKSVKTIHTSYTTVIPTVIYETVEVPCPTPSKPSASVPGNATQPTKTPVPTAGAATMGSSLVLAVAAGVAAMVFA